MVENLPTLDDLGSFIIPALSLTHEAPERLHSCREGKSAIKTSCSCVVLFDGCYGKCRVALTGCVVKISCSVLVRPKFLKIR